MKKAVKFSAGVLVVALLITALSLTLPGFAQTRLNLTSGTANASGDFSINVKIPDDTDPGTYELRARCTAPASGTATSGTYPPTSGTATVSKTNVAPGETITMGGGGCVANATVTIDLVQISAFAALSLAGQAEAQTTTRTLTARITVTGPTRGAAAATTPAPRGALSATGIEAMPWLLAAGAAFVIGAGFIVAGRKRTGKAESTPGS